MIIGISGIAGSGKDTCADILVRERQFVKVSLADPLKRMAREAFAFSDEQLWGPSAMRNAPDVRYPREHTWGAANGGWCACSCCGASVAATWRDDPATKCYLTPRYALQTLGTEWGRHRYPNVWIECAIRVAGKLHEGGYDYSQRAGLDRGYRPGDSTEAISTVVPDIRFRNEVDAFRAAGAKLVRVVRPSAGLEGGAGQHVSEAEQASIPDSAFDAVIVNDGSLEKLEETLLKEIR